MSISDTIDNIMVYHSAIREPTVLGGSGSGIHQQQKRIPTKTTAYPSPLAVMMKSYNNIETCIGVPCHRPMHCDMGVASRQLLILQGE